MKKFAVRLTTMWTLVRLGWTNPGLFTVGTFQSLSALMQLFLKVAKDGQPRMTKLAAIIVNEQHDLVTVWAGKGANADPYERIVQLREECDALRAELSEAIRDSSNP